MDFLSNLLGHISSLNQVASSVTNAIQQVGTEATAVQGALSGDKESALTIAEQGLDAIVYVYSLSGGTKADLIDYLEQGDEPDPDATPASSNN